MRPTLLTALILVSCAPAPLVYPVNPTFPAGPPAKVEVSIICGGLNQGGIGFATTGHWNRLGMDAWKECYRGDVEQMAGAFPVAMGDYRQRLDRGPDVVLKRMLAAHHYACSQPTFLEAYNRNRTCLAVPDCLPMPTCAAVFENAYRFINFQPTLEIVDTAAVARRAAGEEAQRAEAKAREAKAQVLHAAVMRWASEVAEAELVAEGPTEAKKILAKLTAERARCLRERERYLRILEVSRPDYERAKAEHERRANSGEEVCEERVVTSDMVARARSEQGAAAANQIFRLGRYTSCTPKYDSSPFSLTLEEWIVQESKLSSTMVGGRRLNSWKHGPVKVVEACVEDVRHEAFEQRVKDLRGSPHRWPPHVRALE